MEDITPVLYFFKPSSANFFYKSRSFYGIKTSPKANKNGDIRPIQERARRIGLSKSLQSQP
jgi:hypothetical protein